MEASPLVTIAIPTYNRADCYLPQALGSALEQTYQNIDVIVSDNCSTDNTEKVVSAFSDPRVRYFKQVQSTSANTNFNFCLQKAQGIYFLLLHDDDLIDNDFVDICIKAADYEREIGIIRTGTRTIDSKGSVLQESPNMARGLSIEDFFRAWFAGRTSWYLCSTLFNTKRLRDIGGFQSKHNHYQDVMAEVQLAAKYGRIDVRDVKASFRMHKSQMGFTASISEFCEDSLILLDLMCELVSENRTLIRHEGMRFFSRANYGRASNVESPLKRLLAYMIVFKYFNYRYLPSIHHFLYVIYGTATYYGLRAIKRKMKQAFAKL